MLQGILNNSRRQHPTKQQLYGHSPPITKTIQIRRTRHSGHCRRSGDELTSDLLQWTPSHGRPKAERPARTYTQQLCADTRCSLEEQPGAMDNSEGWRERVRDIRADGVAWWSLIICVCVSLVLFSWNHVDLYAFVGWLVGWLVIVFIAYQPHTHTHGHKHIYVVHTISFRTFFVRAFKIVVNSWKFSMLLLYILWDDWPIFMISGSNEQLQQQLEYTLLKPDCHSWWISKNAIGHFRRTICNKILF